MTAAFDELTLLWTARDNGWSVHYWYPDVHTFVRKYWSDGIPAEDDVAYHRAVSDMSRRRLPTFILTRRERLVVAHILPSRGHPEPFAADVLKAFGETGKAEVYLWRPKDFERAIALVSRPED